MIDRYPRYPQSTEQGCPGVKKTLAEATEGDGTMKLPSAPPSLAKSTPGITLTDSATSSLRRVCVGISLEFPPGKNHHSSYPFGLHNTRALPWDYHSVSNKFFLQSTRCTGWIGITKETHQECEACRACKDIRSDDDFNAVMDRIQHGVHPNSTLDYQPIGGLMELVRRKMDQIEQMRLTKLNDNRKLETHAASLADHKQWILAIASGRVERVSALVQAGLKRKVGVKGLISQYERAAVKLYKPKGYTNEDIMRSIVMLRLGGSRIAEFAHRSTFLPSPTTARRNAVLSPLKVSVGKPTVLDAEENILASLGPLEDLDGGSACKIKHQVFVLDELAIEKRPRWDDRTNMLLGACREHGNKVPLEFISEKELDIFCDALDNGDIHAACEVCIIHDF